MVFKMITCLFIVALSVLGASSAALTTTTSSPTTSTSDWSEHPHVDGQDGLPGAGSMVCQKSLDVVHRFSADMLAKAIEASNMPDVSVNVGNRGTLTVKSPRIEEAVLSEFNYDMLPPNKISTRFDEGRLTANGVWQHTPSQGPMSGGTYKVQVRDFRLNVTNQLFRSNEARPSIKVLRCVADISHMRVETRGGDPTTREGMFLTRALAIARGQDNQTMVMDNCDSEACKIIIAHYEREICGIFEGFMEEVINKEMQSVPTKMCIHGDQYRVDYSLLNGEPTVNESSKCIHVGEEGKYLWRNSYGVPFNPAPMEWMNRNSMYSFQLSDFTFNTLFHQAHQSGHRFTASNKDTDESTSSEDEDNDEEELLSMNCDASSVSSHPDEHARKERPSSKRTTTSTTRSTTTKKSTPTSKSTTKRSTPTTRSSTTKSTPTSKSTTTRSTTSKSTSKSTSTSTSSTTSTTTPSSTSTTTSTTSRSTPTPARIRKPRPTRSTTTKSSTSSSTSKSTPSSTTKSTTTRTTSKPKSTTTRPRNPRAASMGEVNEVKCLGSLFANASTLGNGTGDIVFKTNKPNIIFIDSDKRAFFDGSNGFLEFYGAKGRNGQRQLLARADVRMMRGQFTPKLNKANITGTIKLDTLELAPSSQSSWSSSNTNNNVQMTPEWLERAASFSKPMIERAINEFLDKYAQFPVPLPAKYECSSPSMNVMPRTIQMDCDVRQIQCESEPTCRCFRGSCVCSEPCSSKPKRGKNAMKRNKAVRRGA